MTINKAIKMIQNKTFLIKIKKKKIDKNKVISKINFKIMKIN